MRSATSFALLHLAGLGLAIPVPARTLNARVIQDLPAVPVPDFSELPETPAVPGMPELPGGMPTIPEPDVPVYSVPFPITPNFPGTPVLPGLDIPGIPGRLRRGISRRAPPALEDLPNLPRPELPAPELPAPELPVPDYPSFPGTPEEFPEPPTPSLPETAAVPGMPELPGGIPTIPEPKLPEIPGVPTPRRVARDFPELPHFEVPVPNTPSFPETPEVELPGLSDLPNPTLPDPDMPSFRETPELSELPAAPVLPRDKRDNSAVRARQDAVVETRHPIIGDIIDTAGGAIGAAWGAIMPASVNDAPLGPAADITAN
ncbi:hypothetical protein N658DRAFT_490163 [Parathielavia hyrcaniae]|uniref:Uncharacterized protein n=1 Tax=Parathielavia hyrcaniae TaxID=113614 RepID=A0AAN6SW91_9PEZI|nr:hypothetical protein N658DRAFT_490163 [Parathielavia hyrcaniae]